MYVCKEKGDLLLFLRHNAGGFELLHELLLLLLVPHLQLLRERHRLRLMCMYVSIDLSICLSMYLFICLSVYLSI